MNYKDLKTAEAIPAAKSLIETFRAIGYTLETAVADIIDNSLSAMAKNIYIVRTWKGEHSSIAISDDGIGMDNNELIKALTPGTIDPMDYRQGCDLGRFGLGLKTASFSQCRRLTVISKKVNSKICYWTWDLDYVKAYSKWELIQWIPDDYICYLDTLEHGTIVIWTELDRIVASGTQENDVNAKIKFSSDMDKVKQHISMTFHRFIEEDKINFFWNGYLIEPWNPFCLKELKVQILNREKLGASGFIQGYILPHKNDFSTENAFKIAAGVQGYPAQQGFYIYRCKRLILAGDWLGIFRKEEHYKLVRIMVDISNLYDMDWQIDIKKSKAIPPYQLRAQLEAYAKATRIIGEDVYRHRGKILKQKAGQSFQPIWLEKRKDSKWSFVINRDHLVIKELKERAYTNPILAINTLMKFLEESLPTKTIYIKEAKDEEKENEPFLDLDISLVRNILSQLYDGMISQGYTNEQAKNKLATIEPFNYYEDLINKLP